MPKRVRKRLDLVYRGPLSYPSVLSQDSRRYSLWKKWFFFVTFWSIINFARHCDINHACVVIPGGQFLTFNNNASLLYRLAYALARVNSPLSQLLPYLRLSFIYIASCLPSRSDSFLASWESFCKPFTHKYRILSGTVRRKISGA